METLAAKIVSATQKRLGGAWLLLSHDGREALCLAAACEVIMGWQDSASLADAKGLMRAVVAACAAEQCHAARRTQ